MVPSVPFQLKVILTPGASQFSPRVVANHAVPGVPEVKFGLKANSTQRFCTGAASMIWPEL